MRKFPTRILFLVVGGLLAVAAVIYAATRPNKLGSIDESKVSAGLPQEVASLLNKTGALRGLDPVPGARVYLVLREQGDRLSGGWFEGRDAQDAVLKGVEELTRKKPELAKKADVIELCLPHSEKSARVRAEKALLGNVERGVKGVALTYGDHTERVCPTEMVATNRSFEDVEKRFREKNHISPSDYTEDAKAETFGAHQLLLRRTPTPAVVPMFRGNQVIPQSAVNQRSVQALKDGLAHWLTTQVQPDGRMVYRYFPSRGNEADDNNMIRQFMATVSLVRLGNELNDARIHELAKRNLKYNLDHFYVLEGEHGLIRYKDVRLGAVALAALAIVEAPFRAEFASYEHALVKTTEFMLRENGSFQSFYGSQSTDNQNFYPGEALLLWSTLYEQTRDKALMERIQRAFRYYRTWHLTPKNRNPAFIPWHTQAYVRLLLLEDQADMREFVYEMNDWLLSVQQNDGEYPDTHGRFYDPDRPFGPPHASSTAVYLEGLIDAYRLAAKHNDADRKKSYRTAIERGLRSLMQLQFSDGVDMFYIQKREHVLGGLRTTEYDNSIRVDNVQHALMGIQRILRTFNSEGAW